MIKYLKLYYFLVKYNLSRDLQFRSDFWISVIARVVWFFISVSFFYIIYRHTITINGWTYYQSLLLISFFEFTESFLYVFFIANLSQMPTYINDGELDFVLLKPVDAQFFTSFRYFSLASALNLLPPTVLFFIATNKLGTSFSFEQLTVFVVAFFSSIIILYSVWFITVISLFWLAKIYEIHEFFLSLFRFMRFPTSIYEGAVRNFFTFVMPIIFTIAVPVQVILNSIDLKRVAILPILAIITFVVARTVWKLGLKRYSSASS